MPIERSPARVIEAKELKDASAWESSVWPAPIQKSRSHPVDLIRETAAALVDK